MFEFLRQSIESTGYVYFRGTLPPRLHEFDQLAQQQITIQPLADRSGFEWVASMTHPTWGEAQVMAPKQFDAPPRVLLEFDPRLNEDDVTDILACESGLMVSMKGKQKNVLRDRKNFLHFAGALMGDDGVAVCDVTAQRFWPGNVLGMELCHDAELDVDALFSIHAIPDEDAAETEDGLPIAWLHTHGLDQIGCVDFDILNLHPTFRFNLSDMTRAIAFSIMEKRIKVGGDPYAITDPGESFIAVPAERFMTVAPANERLLRDDPEGLHLKKRVVLCDPAKKGFLGFGRKGIRAARWFSKPFNERCVIAFSSDVTTLTAERARGTLPLLKQLYEELSVFELPTLVKLGYQVDGGGPFEMEHLWFEVNGFKGDLVDATLINQPFNISTLNEGDRRDYELERLTDWMIFTPVGQINPRNTGPVQYLRDHRQEVIEMMNEKDESE
jgi:hypothetical protein